MATFSSELRLAVRSLARRPGFAAVAVGTIALAVAANTAMFSIVNAVLLRPLPFPAAEELVLIDSRGTTGFLASISIPNYRDWRNRSRVFHSFSASAPWGLTLTGRGQAEVLEVEALLGDVFGTLRLRPLLGRLPTAAETEPGSEAAAVLSYGFWQNRFGGDPAILGQTMVLDERPYVIIGVLPAGAGFPSPEVQVYVPMGTLPDLPWNDRDSGFGTRAIARLAPGVTLDAARRDLERVGREVREIAGAHASQPELRSLIAYYLDDVRRPLWVLMGGVTFVLLVAVANVGNLLLARGEDRRHELAVRTALGAGRSALARLLLTEAMVIAVTGGVLGAALAYAALGALVPLLPTEVPAGLAQRIAVDRTVLVFAIGLSLVAGTLFGLLPALRAARTAPGGALKSGARTTDPGAARVRAVLVVVETAVALVLLVGAGLLLRSLDRLQKVDKGFQAERVLTVGVAPSDALIPDRQSWRAFYADALERVQALPGVQNAALSLLLPLSSRSWELGIHPEGVPVLPETRESVLYNVVSPEYFETLGVPIVRGRGFAPADRDDAPLVAVIDETMAQRFWPGEDPIGKRVTFETSGAGGEGEPVYREVVGVTKNLRHYQLETPSRIQVYVPFAQTYRRCCMYLRLVLKTDSPPLQLVAPVRDLIATLDPNAPLVGVRTLDSYVGEALGRSRLVSRVLAGFGAAALALAALGVFGVMSYSVTRRRREIGIRIALGATAGDVLRWIGSGTLRLVLLGAGLGLVGAALLTRTVARLLYEVSPLDPAIYATVTAVLLAVAVVAVWWPARRATRVDPVTVLNLEG